MTEQEQPDQNPARRQHGTPDFDRIFGFVLPFDKFEKTRHGRCSFYYRQMAVWSGTADPSILIGTDFRVNRKTGEAYQALTPAYEKYLHDLSRKKVKIPEASKKPSPKLLFNRVRERLHPKLTEPVFDLNSPFPEVTDRLHCVGPDGITPGDIEINAYLSGIGDESVLEGTPFEVVDGILRRKKGFKPRHARSYGDPDYARDVIALDAYMGSGDPSDLEGSSFGEVDRTAYRKLFPGN